MGHEPATPDSRARLLADLVESLSQGHVLQPTAVAVLVDREANDVVPPSLGNGLQTPGAVDRRLQVHLRNVVTLLSVAERHFADVRLAVDWYRTDRPGSDSDETPESLTAGGRLEEAYRRLLRASHGTANHSR